jgi:mannosidase alpha-like ER degradation enhancer 1/mannosidase alpha-like ER degradation enhancer 2
MKNYQILFIPIVFLISCSGSQNPSSESRFELAEEVRNETKRCWEAYKTYAWGSDVLLPISKGSKNWYEHPLYISPIDAYGTLKVMGLNHEAVDIETYVTDTLDFDKDVFVKVFEVNIRVLGGLLSMYQFSGNKEVLKKAEDFGKRMLPAFESGTGIPHYWVNLKSGDVRGDTVNVAEAGTYLLEMGILSYFTGKPVYYQKAKQATKAVYDRRSDMDLIGERIDINTGEWTNTNSHICAGIDSYYEYLYKAWLLFGDPELKEMWDVSIKAIQNHLPEIKDSLLWYRRVNMFTGEKTSSIITLYDAFFPALLALSGKIEEAEQLQETWNWLWKKYGLEPMVYNYETHQATYPVYDLNPEIIESAYYLLHFTGDQKYREMGEKYWSDIKKYCRTEIAYTAIENVETMEKRDYMATYFFAETLKYFYLLFGDHGQFNFDDYIFTTEAHTFKREQFDQNLIKERLGF